MLRDGLHDALLGRLLVLVDQFVDGLEVRDADLALFRVGLGLGRLAGGEQRQRKQYPSEHGGLGEARLHSDVTAGVSWATLG